MDATQIIVASFGALVIGLFTVVAFFVRRIFKQLDGLQTVEACNSKVGYCLALREANRQTLAAETINVRRDADDLRKDFDELCQCLRKFTKGECG